MTDRSEIVERDFNLAGRSLSKIEHGSFEHNFKKRKRFINRTALDQVRKALSIVPCPACRVDSIDGTVEVTQLCVTVEAHPLKEHTTIFNFVCHMCGFQQMLDAPRNIIDAQTAIEINHKNAAGQTRMQAMKDQMAQAERAMMEGFKDKILDIGVVYGGPLNKVMYENPHPQIPEQYTQILPPPRKDPP